MFNQSVYTGRRNQLKKLLKTGIYIFPGNTESPINYPSNTYPFRQDSNFLYFFGINRPGLTGIIDADNDKEYIIGNDYLAESLIWQGKQLSVKELATGIGINNVLSKKEFLDSRKKIISSKKKHWLPIYRRDNLPQLVAMTSLSESEILTGFSKDFIRAVVELRCVKSKDEIQSIREMVNLYTKSLYLALLYINEGVSEQLIAGQLEGFIKSLGGIQPFQMICSVRGEILHNPEYSNILKKNDLLLIDAGAESSKTHYGCDITRVFPVSGKFSPNQKSIYKIVLEANKKSFSMLKPGVFFRDVHVAAARVIAEGLTDLGIMKGKPEDAVYEGAYSLFFPHGLGHMLGLDTHDMGGLGEEYVGYDKNVERTDKYGLSRLRFARELKEGFVITIEPGIYFMPEMIRKWKSEKKLSSFINYSKLEKLMHFGGIRIEDDAAITSTSYVNLSKGIPKEVKDIEKILAERKP
jgi:Xaa-Pro aminopeptidase